MNNGIIYIIISVIINVSGQLSMKIGANKLKGFTPTFNKDIINDINIILHAPATPFIVLGFSLYVFSAVFWIIALSKVNLSFAYPMLSLGYILILFASYFFLKENITIYALLGVILIVAGISLISLNNK